MDNFKLALQQDGFVVTDGDLRPGLPADIRLPSIKTELERLLQKHEFATVKGHLEQALDYLCTRHMLCGQWTVTCLLRGTS